MINKQKVEKEYRKNIELGVIAALLICQTAFLMFRNQRLQVETATREESKSSMIEVIHIFRPPPPAQLPEIKMEIEKIEVPKLIPISVEPREITSEIKSVSVPQPMPVPQEPAAIPNYIPVDEEPSPIGGLEAIRAYLKYPETGRRLYLEGSVYIRALIDENGEVAIVRIAKSSGYPFFDDAAIDAVRSVKWNPGIQHDRPVKAWVSIPVHFKLR